MKTPRSYSDEQLVAFLDGELDALTEKKLKQDLTKSETLSKRLKRLEINCQLIKQAFDAQLHKAPKAPEFEAKPSMRQEPNWMMGRATALASVAALLGLLLGLWLNVPGELSWQQQAASYHALYGVETLSAVKVEEAAATEELSRVSAAIGKPLDFSKLSRTSGLIYKRAQVLHFGNSPLAQLAFVMPDGMPVALCIMPEASAAQSLKSEVMSKLQTVRWAVAGHSYLLVGGQDAVRLQELAVLLQQAVGS